MCLIIWREGGLNTRGGERNLKSPSTLTLKLVVLGGGHNNLRGVREELVLFSV